MNFNPYLPNETHDPKLTSWVESANHANSDFPIQNLPYGVFAVGSALHSNVLPSCESHVGVAIGSHIFDLSAAVDRGLLAALANDVADACHAANLNPLMALNPSAWSALRRELQRLLLSDAPTELQAQVQECLIPQANVQMLVPAAIGDYSDFYASIYHATNVGGMFRPDNPLLPNYKYIPIGYHGRASSIVVSGTPVVRPSGQTRNDAAQPPVFGPSRRLDYELEVGCFVGTGNRLGTPIPQAEAEAHMFGICLLNDWSARDMQTWEYQPLGPFLAKSFVTTVSPWVVTMEALAPFRVASMKRAEGDPMPLPYLTGAGDRSYGGINLTVEVYICSAQMRQQHLEPFRVSTGNLRDLYWTLAQMLTHHASNGCNLRPGDLFASGTISGPTKESRGCLLELTWRGSEPLTLPSGEARRFLEEGDEVIMRAHAGAESRDYRRIGCGECRGVVMAVGTK